MVGRVDAILDRLDLELALAHVLEVLGRPEEHVDERADVRDHERDEHRETDEQRVFHPALRVLVRPKAEAEPEDEGEEEQAIEDGVRGPGADEAGGRHERSARRYRDPVTSTAPSGPANSSARVRAAAGSGTDSTFSKCAEASAASAAAGSARPLRLSVATSAGPRMESASSIIPGRLSRRIEQTTVHPPGGADGSRGSSQPMPARLWAPSQISRGCSLRRSRRPASET